MSNENDLETDPEMQLLSLLYLAVLYLGGTDEHNPFLADPFPKRPNSPDWHTHETFTHLHSYLKPDRQILNSLEAAGWIEQPQKSKKHQHHVLVTKRGMQQARELLQCLPLPGIQAALEARAYHQDCIQHQNKIDLQAAQARHNR